MKREAQEIINEDFGSTSGGDGVSVRTGTASSLRTDAALTARLQRAASEASTTEQFDDAQKLAKLHGKNCKCCICRGMKNRPGAQYTAKTAKLHPCVCGSVICKKDWSKLKREERNRKLQKSLRLKKCICGSNICDEESQKMPEVLLEAAKQIDNEKYKAKQAKKKEKLYQKKRKERAKKNKKKFKKLRKMRKKEDKHKMRTVKKNLNQGTVSLMAESFIDLGTFGSKAFCDVARYVFDAVRHPRDSISEIREAANNPVQTAMAMRQTAEGMGLYATLARILTRLKGMPATKDAKSSLELYPATNYLIHMADADPKKRLKKFKTKRKREPLDFQCSLYMASMRKRPCLRIYYMCPWFYPHCMSLLNVWKQFMDVMLFLLAVVVWSPCILCMEICRGFVCCGLCQG